MTTIPIYQADAFTNKLFGGNPAAICPLDTWLPDEVMQKIAIENNLAETAFFVKNDAGYKLRWFTPEYEIDLCGHATLASAHILFTQLGYKGDEIHFDTVKAGTLTVKRDGDKYTMDFPSRPPIHIDPPVGLVEALGEKQPLEVLRSRDYFLVYESESDIRDISPDFFALSKMDTVGVIVTAPGDHADFVSRFFAPGAGIPEDPVTGSAHCNLIPYWAEKLGKIKLHAYQLSFREGELWCEQKGDRVLMSGKAVTYFKGGDFCLAMPDNKPFVPGKYIDPLVDFAFKKIFGSEPNKDLLIAFLNEVFRGRKHIVDLVYNKNEYPGDLKDEGAAIFDLLCTGTNGEKFLIEVQRGRQGNFKERALFYTSRLISDQAPKGKRSEWAYNLTEVYLVALLEDFTSQISNDNEYLHDICLCNRETGEIFYDKLGYTYIELRKFVKEETDLLTDLDKWLYVLKHMSRMDKIPVYLRKPIFEKLFNIAEYSNMTKEEKTMYDSSLKYKWDNKNVLDYAKQEARQEGLQEGIQEGIEQGIQQGEYKKALDIAHEMKKDGIPDAQISKFTGLSLEEISKL